MSKELSTYKFKGENGRDEFKREPIAEKIITLLMSDIDLSPMIIDGDWGTGKSEFCHKLINKFKDEHSNDGQIIYIDAFKADHADNPLMTIIAEIMTLIPDAEKKEGFLKKALPVIRYGTKAIFKAGVSHIMRENADNLADSLEASIQDAANTAIDATVAALLKDHEESEKNLKALQSLLEELAKDQPIIIFIDELDRCRPDFSVHMLEVIKHTFNVKNVKFVLVTNTTQLKAAINHAYGSSINASRYLDKFIKFTIALPNKFEHNFQPQISSVAYFNQLIKQSKTLNQTDFINLQIASTKLTHDLIAYNQLSLREVETFIRYLEIANALNINFTEKTIFGYKMLFIIGIFILCFKPNLYSDIKNNDINADEIMNLLGLNLNSVKFNGVIGIILLLASHAQKNQTEIQKYITEYDTSAHQTLEQIYFPSWGFDESSYFQPILSIIDTMHLIKEKNE